MLKRTNDREQICRQYLRNGSCAFGERCRYLHIESSEDLYHLLMSLDRRPFSYAYQNFKPSPKELCKFYAAGFCVTGSRCNAKHDSNAINAKEDAWIQYEGNDPLHKPICLPREFDVSNLSKQPFRYLLIVDLEGKDEIIELPCILLDCQTMCEVGRFHRFIFPSSWSFSNEKAASDPTRYNSERRSVPFAEALQELTSWLVDHWGCDVNGDGNGYSFVPAICGNWDVKTQIPRQCQISNIPVPAWCDSWLNMKDLAANFYGVDPTVVRGMSSTLQFLEMDLWGTHHLGMDDTTNIARILVHMAQEGAVLMHTASRDERGRVRYRFDDEHRVSLRSTPRRREYDGGVRFGRGRGRGRGR